MFLTSFIQALRAVVVVAKLVILCISFLTSFILALGVLLVATLVISSILSSIYLILALESVLTTSLFTTSLGLPKSAGTGPNLSTSSLSTLLFRLFKLLDTFFNLSISNLSTLDCKLAKSPYLANVDVSTPVAFLTIAFFNYYLLHFQFLLFVQEILVLENIHSFLLCLFNQPNC